MFATVPMWFGLPDATTPTRPSRRLQPKTIRPTGACASSLSNSKVYDGSGYHYGSVWPLFTGWASVGEYRYHRAFPAYSNLRSNALLGVDGALGHFSEVLSGDYYQSFSTSSPHQIWSAAMVVSPILRGMFGLQTDAEKHQISLDPHMPADWTTFAVTECTHRRRDVDFQYRKMSDSVTRSKSRAPGAEIVG